ncbi:flavin reductase family protein [Streptomyces chiangmaiensis]|uniref:Flavin reductase family protein n=1 Tax=Streptomyces chiangmaiensis TaxID=766497 RepID=A0ABU7FKL8_9ACTN|nr:flavin reductase family protein [Streptomyces chiangmaiensis]MED7824645.1 flavin reductase family protein [Streptomyces chiangmaiensis]
MSYHLRRNTTAHDREGANVIINSDELDVRSAYKLLIGSITPRAIGWVSTLSPSGIANLAPISFFTVVSRKPPMVSLTIQPRSDGKTLKDTLVNIRDTGEFVTNLVTLPHAHDMHRSAVEFDSDQDEFTEVGLAKASCEAVNVPRVKDAPIALECTLDRIIPVGDAQDHVVWGKVVRFHIRDDLYTETGRIDTGAIPTVGRLAAEYTLADNAFVTPLTEEVLRSRVDGRMKRLDQRPDDWSPVDTAGWSPSGSTRA